jgi:hypothetical protein
MAGGHRMSAELVCMNATDARAITDRIKTGVDLIWELIKQAYNERAWDALGYASWDDYCTREFGSSRIRLPREERAEVVSSLRESGLSIRAIAAATGIDSKTVQSDLKAGVGISHTSPQPEPVDVDEADDTADCIHCGQTLPLTNLYEGGMGYECDPCVTPDEDDVDTESLVAPIPAPTITGTDGKKYPQKPAAPKEPRRKPITDAFDSASYDLKKVVERVVRLVQDDRFTKNKDQISGANLSDLVRVRDALNGVIQQLEG